jgi:hypothetical protein
MMQEPRGMLRCFTLMRRGLRLMWGTRAFPSTLAASSRSGMFLLNPTRPCVGAGLSGAFGESTEV